MLRLFSQPIARIATGHIARTHVARTHVRRLTDGLGDGDGFPETVEKQGPETTVDTSSAGKQGWVPNNNDRLWDHVNRLDDRVAGLGKDMGDFKGDVNRALGDLAARMEAGFGRMEKTNGELKADIKTLVWQVGILFGGASLVVGLLIKTYIDEQHIFSQRQRHAMLQPISGPAPVAIAQKVEPSS